MFTGIITHLGHVAAINRQPGLITLTVSVPAAATSALATGASVAIDGCCLTVVRFTSDSITFEIMQQTVDMTTFGQLSENQAVNIERSLRFGDEIGGHLLSGHIHGTMTITDIVASDNNYRLTCQYPAEIAKYILPKGFIALHGASLTIAEVDKDNHQLTVCLIPETLSRTNLSSKKVGDRLNFEIDHQTQTIVETVLSTLIHTV